MATSDADNTKTEQGTSSEDRWSRIKLRAEIVDLAAKTVIAFAVLGFTVLYGQKQQGVAESNLRLAERQQAIAQSNLELAQSNKDIAKAQLEAALIPWLSSADYKQRSMALSVASTVDKDFAVEMNGLFSLKDPNLEVRQTAGLALAVLSHSPRQELKERAEKSLDRYDIVNELRSKGLLRKLNEAQSWLNANNSVGKERALQLYRDVLAHLSSTTSLDQNLLREAEKDYREGHYDDALRIYSALFADFLQVAS
jgi:hypothetical protein